MNRISSPPPIPPDALRDAVDWAIVTRRSIRAFLPKPFTPLELGTAVRSLLNRRA